MITLDQVLLLQKKTENAVQKIVSLEAQNKQLNSENDALRTKCSELSKALSEKTELLSRLQDNQSKIESGILNALTRLDTVETESDVNPASVSSASDNEFSAQMNNSSENSVSESVKNDNYYQLSANPQVNENSVEKTLEQPNFIQDSLDLPPINFSSKTPEIDESFDIF